jgi:catechol 2,3-dioxygenase-like lactoylglutathione lyase family enzyme
MVTQLHNVTIYVGRDDFDDVRWFYANQVGLPVVFEEPGHISCFGSGKDVAICIHEAEPGHPAGTRELFLWVDDARVDPDAELHLDDPVGNQIRLHRRLPEPGA